MNEQVQRVVISVEREPSNSLATAGLIFSILGWLTCGLLCIPGAFLSFLGLAGKPKGLAVVGLIVGFPGVIFFFVAGMGILAGFLGIGAAVNMARNDLENQQKKAVLPIESAPEAEAPKEVVEEKTPEPIPEEKPVENLKAADPYAKRVFSDRTGKFSVEATVISSGAGMVSIKRIDTEKIITLEIAKLSDFDQRWLAVNFPD